MFDLESAIRIKANFDLTVSLFGFEVIEFAASGIDDKDDDGDPELTLKKLEVGGQSIAKDMTIEVPAGEFRAAAMGLVGTILGAAATVPGVGDALKKLGIRA